MAARLSSASRTPISERIKLFDAGGSKPRGTPSKPSPKSPAPVVAPQSPVLKPINAPRSQFSTKDPTSGKPALPSANKRSPTNSVASSKSDLSRSPSNASTKSADVSKSSSWAPVKREKSTRAANAQNSPAVSPAKKVGTGSSSHTTVKKTVSKSSSNKSTSQRESSATSNGHHATSNSSTSHSKKDDSLSNSPTTTKCPSTPSPAVKITTTAPTPPNVEGVLSVNEPPKAGNISATVQEVTSPSPLAKPSVKKTSISENHNSPIKIGSKSEFDNYNIDSVDRAYAHVNNKENTQVFEAATLEKNVINRKSSVSSVTSNGATKGGYDDSNYWSKQALKNHTSESISQAMKLDVETKDEKICSLQKELSEMQMGGATEDEVRSLKKSKKDLEMQLKEQEEELDDLAAQVQMLEASKTKLEMEMATIKKEHRREVTNKDEEIEEARMSANKKVKILEQQLEQEHEERIMFLRERHDLEQKIGTLQDMLERSGDEEQVSKLKRDLKKTKALLRDAQTLVEKTQNEGTNKVILRQLKNQLEDAEFARTAAMKARQNAELELADTQTQLEDVSRSKQDLEDRHLRLSREKAELASQLQENEEELQEVMRKYKASVAAVSTDQITIQDQQNTIQELENERNKLRDQVAELSSKLGNLEGENVSTSQHKRLELKIRELESKLELEITSKNRMETQIQRLKDTIEKVTKEKDDLRIREQNSVDSLKKSARQLRDLKEDYATIQGKETELSHKKFDLEKQLEVAEAETLTVRSDLKLAMKRIEDLQAAIAGELDSDNSDDNSDSSDEEMHSFLEHHRRAMSVQRERESMARESVLRESILRESVGRDSVHRESVSRDVRASVGRTFSAIDETKESNSLDSSKPLTATIEEGDESQA